MVGPERSRRPTRWVGMSALICPKCGSDMRSYERNRVLVDQCTGCGGLFLDRGELEQLVTAETAWHAGNQPQQPQQPMPQQQSYAASQHGGQPYGDQRGGSSYGNQQHGGYPPRRKKKSFLSELFDD